LLCFRAWCFRAVAVLVGVLVGLPCWIFSVALVRVLGWWLVFVSVCLCSGFGVCVVAYFGAVGILFVVFVVTYFVVG